MEYNVKFESEDRQLSDEALAWLEAVSGGNFDFEEVCSEDQMCSWFEVQFKRKGEPTVTICSFEEREVAVKVWSELKQQKFALGILHGNKAQSRQWFAAGEGQKRVSNSTGWTDL